MEATATAMTAVETIRKLSDATRDPGTSLQLRAPYLSGQESMEVLEQAMKDLGDNLSKFHRSNGDQFMGNVVAGKPEGVGIMFYRENDPHGRVAYRGEFRDGQRHGIGIMWWLDGSSYEGQWRENKPDGYGLETYPDGGVYSGQFSNDCRQGMGAYAFADGKFFVGNWDGGVQHGIGISKARDSTEVVTVYEKGEIKEALPANEESKEQMIEIQKELADILQQTEAVADEARVAAEKIEVLHSVSSLLPVAVRPLSGKVQPARTVEPPPTRDLLLDGLHDPEPPEEAFDISRATSAFDISRATSVPQKQTPKSPVVEAEDRATSQLFQSLREQPNAEFLSANLGSLNSLKPFAEPKSIAAAQFSSINLGSKTARALDSVKAAALQNEENNQTKSLLLSAAAPDLSLQVRSVQSVKTCIKDSPQEDKESQETAKLFSSLRLSSAESKPATRSPALTPRFQDPPLSIRSTPVSPEMKAASVVDGENAEMKQLFDSLHATKSLSRGTNLFEDADSAAGNPDEPDRQLLNKETEAAVKIQSGLRGMIDRRRADKLKQEEQREVETIAENDGEEEEEDDDEWAALPTQAGWRRAQDRQSAAVTSSNLHLIDEDSEALEEGLAGSLGSFTSLGEKRGSPKERAVIALQPLAETEDADDADDEKEDVFGRVKSEAGQLHMIEEDEEDREDKANAVKTQEVESLGEEEGSREESKEEGDQGASESQATPKPEEGDRTEWPADDIGCLMAEGARLLQGLSMEQAGAIASTIAAECPRSPVARAIVDMMPPLDAAEQAGAGDAEEEIGQAGRRAAQEEEEEEAALKIQCGLRGMRDRKAAKEKLRLKREDEARTRQQEQQAESRNESQATCTPEAEAEQAAAIKIQSGLRGMRDRKAVQERREAGKWPTRELQVLVSEGAALLSSLPTEHACDVLRTLQSQGPSSPLARVLCGELPEAPTDDPIGESAAETEPEPGSVHEIPKLALNLLGAEEDEAARDDRVLPTRSSVGLRASLSERSKECLESVIREGRELMARMDGLDSDVLSVLADKVGTSPLASVLYYEATSILARQRGGQSVGSNDPPERTSSMVLSQRTWHNLEDLVAEGSQLLERFEQEDAEGVLRTIREAAGSSPLATLLLDQLLSFRPRGIIRDPAAMRAALSARSQRNLADLLQSGRQLLGALTQEQGESVLSTLRHSARSSPLAAALLYEAVCEPPGAPAQPPSDSSPAEPRDQQCQLTARTRGALEELVKEGQELGKRLQEEQTEALLLTLQEWAGSNTTAAAITYDLLTHQPPRPRSASGHHAQRRAMSARSRRRLQELKVEGLELVQRLGEVGDHRLLQMLPEMAPTNPLAAVLYSELITSWFSEGGATRTDLQNSEGMRRALSERSKARLEELMVEGQALMGRLDEGNTNDVLRTVLSANSPIASVIRAEILAGRLSAPAAEAPAEARESAEAEDEPTAEEASGEEAEKGDGSLLTARTRERVEELLGECGKLLGSVDEGTADSLLTTIRDQAGHSPLSSVLYNALLWSLTGRSHEAADGADGWKDFSELVRGVSDDARQEVGKLVSQSASLMDALGQGGAQSVLEIVRGQQGTSPLATVMYNKVLEGLAEWIDEEQDEAVDEEKERAAQLEQEAAAALTIQCGVRGMLARRQHGRRASEALAAACAREELAAREREAARQEAAAKTIQCGLRCMAARRRVQTRRAEQQKRQSNGPSPDEFPDPVPADPFWFVETMKEDLRSEVHTYLWRKRMEEGSPFAAIAQRLQQREIGPHDACIQAELLLLPIRWRNTRATSTSLPLSPFSFSRNRFKPSLRGSEMRALGFHARRLRRFKSDAQQRARVAWNWAPKHAVQRESREYDASDAERRRRQTTFNAVREVCLSRATRRDFEREVRQASGLPFRDIALIRCIQTERARQNFEKELVLHKRRVRIGRRSRPPSAEKQIVEQVVAEAQRRFGLRTARRSAEVIQRRMRAHTARHGMAEAMVRRDLRIAAVSRLQRWGRKTMQRWDARVEMRNRIDAKLQAARERAAAVVVQGAYRGRLARLDRRFLARIMDQRVEEQERLAVVKTQAFFRKMLARKMVSRVKQNKLTRIDTNLPLRASILLQCAIRSHWARRAYFAVKDTHFLGFACRVAIRLQCWSRRMVAKRNARKVAKSLLMMQQWSAAFAWRRTVTDLTRLAAADWRSLVKHVGEIVGPTMAFREAQELQPAVMPTWWLGHFPVSFSSRVNLKATPLVHLQEQLRKDRILALGGASKFEKSLQLVAELVREVTQVHAEALELSESYEALVSLLAFCNINGCELAARGEPSSKHAGHELLMYAGKLADGPNLSVAGMREKLEFRQWTHCNLARVFYLAGEFETASHHARLLASISTGEPRRDTLTKVSSLLYLAAIQSKACKHNTAVATLQSAADALSKWVAEKKPEAAPKSSWSTFCCSKDLTRRYFCTPSHLAAVCQYNLSVELAAREQFAPAVVAAKRAVALAAVDKLAEPLFHRRALNTLAAIKVVHHQPPSAVSRRPPEIIRRLGSLPHLQAADDSLNLSVPDYSRPGTSNSSILSSQETVRIYRPSQTPTTGYRTPQASPAAPPSKAHFDASSPPPHEDGPLPLHVETSRRRFGVWFPPHVALRNKIDLGRQVDEQPQHPDASTDDLAPPSPSAVSTASTLQEAPSSAFLRATPSLVESKLHGPILPSPKLAPVAPLEKRQLPASSWHTKRNLLEAQLDAELLLLNVVPVHDLDLLEMLTPEGVSLRVEVLAASTPKLALDGIVSALKATNTHSNLGLKPSPATRSTLRDICTIAVLASSRYLSAGQEGLAASGPSQVEKEQAVATMRARTKAAEKLARVASTVLFGGVFKNQLHDLKGLVRMQIALCLALQGQLEAALFSMMELKKACANKSERTQMLTVVLLNLATMMSKMEMHKEAFEACDDAWQLLRAMDSQDDWNCFSPGHGIEETTRVPWTMLCGFCKFQQSAQSLWMGFEGPALKLAEKSHALTHQKGAQATLPPDAVLATATEKVLQCILEWSQAMATPPLLSRWIASVPPPPEEIVPLVGTPVRVVKQLGGDRGQIHALPIERGPQLRSVRQKVW